MTQVTRDFSSCHAGGFGLPDPDFKLKDYSPEQWQDLLYKPATKAKIGESLTAQHLRSYVS